MLFTNPVTRTGAGFAALKGNPKGVKSIADVAAHADAIVGTQNGAAQVCVAALKSTARQCMTRTGSIMGFSGPPAASDGRPTRAG